MVVLIFETIIIYSMNLIALGLALLTFVSTMVGGLIAVRYRNVLQYFFAFASGSLLAVTFFDILPESLNISTEAQLPVRYIFVTVVAFFFLYSLVERFFLTYKIEYATETFITITHYNNERPHMSLNYKTPKEIWNELVK